MSRKPSLRLWAMLLGRAGVRLEERHGFWWVIFLLCVVAIESGLLVLFMMSSEFIVPILSVHFLISALVWGWAIREFVHFRAGVFPLFFAFYVTIMGALGALSSIGMLWLFRILPQVDMEEWLDSMQNTYEAVPQAQMLDRLARQRHVLSDKKNSLSFHELMLVGSVPQKQEVLGAIAQFFHPSLAPLLKRALNDESSLVRTQAAATLSKIQKQFLQRAMRLEKKLEASPELPELWLEAAQFYDSYAFAGILDEHGEQELRKKALHYFERYAHAFPTHWQSYRAIGRLHFRAKDFRAACSWFETYREHEMQAGEMVFWLMECYFRLHQYKKVKMLALDTKHLDERAIAQLPLELVEAIRLWRGEAA